MAIVKCPKCGHILTVPEKKTGLWWGLGCLVACVAGLIMVAIVGMLAAIAIPSFVKARETSQRMACVNNLRQLDAAKEQAALEGGLEAGALTTPEAAAEQVSQYVAGGLEAMQCPAGGTYTLHAIGEEPECSVHGTMSRAGMHGGGSRARPGGGGAGD